MNLSTKQIWSWVTKPIFWLCGLLTQSSVPLWVTLMLTVGGTYWLAPVINANIQRENLRRDFLVSSLDALSTDTIALISKVNGQVRSGKITDAEGVVQSILNIHYRLVQLNISLPGNLDAGISVQKSLAELQDLITDSSASMSDISGKLSEFSRSSFALYSETVKSAGLL